MRRLPAEYSAIPDTHAHTHPAPMSMHRQPHSTSCHVCMHTITHTLALTYMWIRGHAGSHSHTQVSPMAQLELFSEAGSRWGQESGLSSAGNAVFI